MHVIRTGKIPFVQSKASLPLMVTTLTDLRHRRGLPYSQFAHALNLVALPHQYWFALTAMLLAYLSLTQVVKTWLIRRFGLG